MSTSVVAAETPTVERDAFGNVVEIHGGGRTYLRVDGGTRIFGDGFVEIEEVELPRGRLRSVRTAAGERWIEEYEWDAAGRLTRVDGVTVERDHAGRVVACRSKAAEWCYGYERARLVSINGPYGERVIPRGPDGRPIALHGPPERPIRYDSGGVRLGVPPPPRTWHRDPLGRLLEVTTPAGEVLATWLWDGFACLGRIDGPLGAPLAAVFSLDPTLTPVRIVTAKGSRPILRDAFGEALLAEDGVPGLFGGAVRDGFVHLRSRALDPTTGSWHSADPWHGFAGDPRRSDGYGGPLAVEDAAAGPYAVCRNDPLARVDPTGEISVPLVLSTLTHSHANNLLGIFGLDLTLNFWGCLFTGQLDRFFSMEGVSSSSREGSFGMRRDGWVAMGNRAWTFQHLVWATVEHIDELQDIRVFDPGGAFEPDLYGTLLRIEPSSGGQPFVLRGSGNVGADLPGRALGWSRAGGVGVPVVPGSPLPKFPSGGIHFDRFQPQVRDKAGKLSVLTPTGALHQGTLDIGDTVVVSVQSLFAPGNDRRVLLNAGGVARFAKVKDSSSHGNRKTLVLQLEPGGDPPGEDATLRGAAAEGAAEVMSRGADNRRLVPPAGSNADNYKDHALALAQGGTALGVVVVSDVKGGELVLSARLPGNTANPYDVKRSKLESPNLEDLSVRVPATVKLPGTPPPNVTGAALEIQRLSTASIAPKTTALTGTRLNGAVLTATLPAPPPGAPTPSQVVLLQDTGGADTEPAVVKALHLNVTLDRDVTSSASTFEAVPIAATGPSYRAGPKDASTIVVRPDVGGIRTEMPRFGVGELIEVSGAGLAPTRLYRVTAVNGATLMLTGDAGLPAPPAALTVRRVLPTDPSTGGSRLGVRGKTTGPRAFAFDVWKPNAMPLNATIGIDDGSVCHPARISALGDLQLELYAAPTKVGQGSPAPTVDVKLPGYEVVTHAATFSQSGDTLTLNDLVAPVGASTNVVFIVPFKGAGQSQDGALAAGNVMVPEALNAELDRKAALLEHELRHTLQSAMWGPFLLCWFPLNVFEGIVEASSDVELPDWGPYVSADLVTDGGARWIKLPGGFSKGDTVQVSAGNRVSAVEVGEKRADGRFQAKVSTIVPDGAVSARKQKSTAAEVWTVVFDIMEIFTHGGMLNLLAGSVWGSLFFLIGHGFHALGRLISGSAKTYPAAVENDGIVLRLKDADGKAALASVSKVSVSKDDLVLVRDVANVIDDAITLKTDVDLRGDVHVAPYSLVQPDALWDWHDWYPVTFPDISKPAAVKVEEVNGKKLELRAHDRVSVSVRGTTNRTNVSAVEADGMVELEDVPGHGLAPGDVRIAKVGEDDPIGNLDSKLLTEMGQGWMRWLFDPYGQIQYRQDVEKGSFWDVTARVVRFLLSTQSYSALFPPGWWFWDNALRQKDDEGHLSQMEQDASQESGDLYSTLARLDGSVTHVGDIARYWVFEQWRRNSNIVMTQGDAAGVHLADRPRLVPFRTAESKAAKPSDVLNKDSEALPVPPTPAGGTPPPGPGDALPDLFAQKSAADPRDVVGTPRLFAPTALGFVPTSPQLERVVGGYVAFSRPTSGAERHRVTTANIQDPENARAAMGKQKILFDLQIADVTVTLAGVTVDEGSSQVLVATQRARLKVEPNSGRRYAATVVDPSGPNLGLLGGEDLGLDAGPTATPANDPEPVEISRLHAFTPDASKPRGGTFASPGLSERGLNVPMSVHVPVRRFSVEVVTTLDFRSAPDLAAAVVASLKPGEHGFLIVPADLRSGVRGVFSYPGVATPVTPGDDPVPTPSAEPTPDTLKELLSLGGGVVKVLFPADDPPEERAEVRLEVDVGRAGRAATLTSKVTLEPHLRLALPAGAVDNHVARGASIILTCDGATPAPDVTIDRARGVTAAVSGKDVTVTVAGNAAKGKCRVVVTDATDATKKARRTIEIV